VGTGSRIQINNGFLEPCEIVSGRWILTDRDGSLAHSGALWAAHMEQQG
jgi:uncharacterized cupin superfamily protein